METLYELVNKVKSGDEEASRRLLKKLEPKLNKAVQNFSLHEREDVKQDLKIKILSAVKTFDFSQTPGLWEFLHQK
ncbi:helix-turn-helix domain-containing protein [Priestia sp. RMT2NF4]|uniref:helix-turn-helix domain-containing protein n=1 Tax=Priestia sp. RMT2NF4 TaxID=3398394 RepID=UPI003A4C7787